MKPEKHTHRSAEVEAGPDGRRFLFTVESQGALLDACRANAPKQSFGVLLGDRPRVCRSFFLFKKNVREADPEIRKRFAAYGPFYSASGRGYWVDPGEQLDLFMRLDGTNQRITAFFHTHMVLDAEPTAIDYDLHFHRDVPMIVLSLADRKQPVILGFQFEDGQWSRLDVESVKEEEEKAGIN